ncbi:MAG: KTSC domain-containing protein [Legionellaceae bacterium]|nr:KTSC domain-containing protein [Legionellaceae bacterium]
MKNTITLDNQKLEIDPRLAGFSINKKPSSNIDFFGHNPESDSLFFQFRNGTTYIFKGVPIDILKAAQEHESIGSFFHAHIKGKYESEGISERLVIIDREEMV